MTPPVAMLARRKPDVTPTPVAAEKKKEVPAMGKQVFIETVLNAVLPERFQQVAPDLLDDMMARTGTSTREEMIRASAWEMMNDAPELMKLFDGMGDKKEEQNNQDDANTQPRLLTEEELQSHVLFSRALIDLRGAFKLTTVVTVYAPKAYEGKDWRQESTHLKRQNGLSADHLRSHVGVTANEGLVKMVACATLSDTMFSGREPKRDGWKKYQPDPAMGQTVGMAVHEIWKRQGNTGGAWTVKDLCEVVLCRYREKRTTKPGSLLYGARARIAVDDHEDDLDPANLPTLLKLSQYCGDQRPGAWAITGGFVEIA